MYILPACRIYKVARCVPPRSWACCMNRESCSRANITCRTEKGDAAHDTEVNLSIKKNLAPPGTSSRTQIWGRIAFAGRKRCGVKYSNTCRNGSVGGVRPADVLKGGLYMHVHSKLLAARA
jgi:hypothetical protein